MTGCVISKKTSAGKEYLYINLKYKDPENGTWKNKMISTKMLAKGNKRRAKQLIPGLIEEYAYLEAVIQSLPIHSDVLVVDYLESWLLRKEGEIRKSTFEGYRYRVDKMKEYFTQTGIALKDLTPKEVNDFLDYSLKFGKRNQKTGKMEPLSVRSVRSYKSILSAACDQAVLEGLIRLNPAAGVTIRGTSNKKYAKQPLFLTNSEVEEFLRFLKSYDPKLTGLAFVAFYYGLRRSEILGLKWDAVDIRQGVLHIRNTVVRVKTVTEDNKVKTNAGYRDLDLFNGARKCFENIRSEQDANKDFYGNAYQDGGYVFCWPDGRAYEPNYITRRFSKAARKFGRPEITLHKARHTCASILIERGFDIKRIQHWLGHEDITTTLNIYSHYIKHQNNLDGNEIDKISASVAADLFGE